MQNLYEILAIECSALPIAVRSAYRRRALATHPDKPGGSAVVFRKIVSAFEVLGDASRRAAYDNQLASAASNACSSPFQKRAAAAAAQQAGTEHPVVVVEAVV